MLRMERTIPALPLDLRPKAAHCDPIGLNSCRFYTQCYGAQLSAWEVDELPVPDVG